MHEARDVTVVGGGLGGLATAIRLAHAGWSVTVLEKNDCLGGRCNRLVMGPFLFDTGPTLLLMPDVLDDLFRSVGKRMEDYLELLRVYPNYQVHFGDSSSIEISGDLDRVGAQLEGIEPGASAAFRRYVEDAGYKYRVSRQRFVERNFEHWYQFFTPINLYYVLTTNTLRKLDRHARRYFRDRRLIDALTFQTMYLGLAPGDAPSVYALLPWTELLEGIWLPRGGMYRIVEALAQVAGELGVRIETGREVTRIISERGAVTGVQLADGEVRQVRHVVCNADLPYAYQNLLSSQDAGRSVRRTARLDYGSSAFLMYLGVDREYPHLLHHDVYLSADTSDNFDAIFRRRELPADPSFYVCLPQRTDPGLAVPGGEAIYVLVPVPHASPRIDWAREREPFRDRVYGRLESMGLTDLRRHVIHERIYTPDDFVSDYHIANGSAFGISHKFTQVGYMRPSNRASKPRNLYFVGASTVPGGGVPMVILGSRLTAERVQRDAKVA